MMKILIWFCLTAGLILLLLPSHTESYTAPEAPKLPPIKQYAEERVIEVFGSGWPEFNRIIIKESNNWTVTTAHYPSGYAWVKQKDGTYKKVKSSAYGLGGFLDQTWKDVGCVKTKDPYTQIDCTIKYIQARYGNPQKALKHHLAKNWY